MKLTKQQGRKHSEAMALVDSDNPLTQEQKEFILDHYHPGCCHNTTVSGAFFTPRVVARDLAVMHGTRGKRVVDLCAGIGQLAYAVFNQYWGEEIEMTCVEINPEYIKVGKRVLPEATWIQGDVFQVALGHFDSAFSNPPFGAIQTTDKGRGAMHMDVCGLILEHSKNGGVVIIPNSDHANERERRPVSSNYRRWKTKYPLASIVECPIDMDAYRENDDGSPV